MEQQFLLELDGKLAGRLFDYQSVGAAPDVIKASGPGLINRKHLGGVRYQAMVLACGTGMSQSFYDWVSSTFRKQYARRGGAVITLDRLSKPVARLNFDQALVSLLALPKLDVSSNQAAHMKITVQPARTSIGSTESQSLGAYSSAIPKAWKTRHFRLKIDGLETDCRHVTKVEELRLGQGIVANPVGERRNLDIEPSKIDFPNLVLQLPQSFSAKFNQWFQSFVVQGQNTSDDERDGTLDFLAPGTATPYFSLKFKGLGIHSMTPVAAGSVKVELYCEEMDFSAGAAAVK